MQSQFNSIIELVSYFSSDEKCLKHIEQWRWNGEPECIRCGCKKLYDFKSNGITKNRFKCSKCYYQFTATTGTIFHSRKVPLVKWFLAIYLNSSDKKGISSYQLARDILVTQKTAWFMLTKLREAYKENDTTPLDGIIMADETFVGGKNKNRHIDKKVKYMPGRDFPDKIPVLGLVQMEGRARLFAIPNTSKEVIHPIVYNTVKKGSTFVSDEWRTYLEMGTHYDHQMVDHGRRQFRNDCGFSTNAVEGLWGIVKRTYNGTYHNMSKKHIQRYMDEIAFRYNTRQMSSGERLNLIMGKVSFKLTQKQIINEEAIPSFLIAPLAKVRRAYIRSGQHKERYQRDKLRRLGEGSQETAPEA